MTVADIRSDRLARAERLGATLTVDTSADPLRAAVLAATDGAGSDLTYEVTGVQGGLDLAGEVTRMGGKLCIVGYHLGGTRTVPLGHWNWMGFKILNGHFRDRGTIMGGMRAGMRLVNAGSIDVAQLVSHHYPLDRIAEAFEVAAAMPEGFTKAVIEQAD